MFLNRNYASPDQFLDLLQQGNDRWAENEVGNWELLINPKATIISKKKSIIVASNFSQFA